MDKNQYLAENVLGWTLDDIACPPVYLKDNGSTCIASSFQPDKHIIHAMMLIEHYRFKSMIWVCISDLWQVETGNKLDSLKTARKGSLHEAITESVLQVSGYYNEKKK